MPHAPECQVMKNQMLKMQNEQSAKRLKYRMPNAQNANGSNQMLKKQNAPCATSSKGKMPKMLHS